MTRSAMSFASIALRHALSFLLATVILTGLTVAVGLPWTGWLPGRGMLDVLPAAVVVAIPCAVLWSSLRTLALPADRRRTTEAVLAGAGFATIVSFGAYLLAPAANERVTLAMAASHGWAPPESKGFPSQSLGDLVRSAAEIASRPSPTAADLRLLALARHEIGDRFAIPALAPLFALVALLMTGRRPGWGRIGSAIIVATAASTWSWSGSKLFLVALRHPDAAMAFAFVPGVLVLLVALLIGGVLELRRGDVAG